MQQTIALGSDEPVHTHMNLAPKSRRFINFIIDYVAVTIFAYLLSFLVYFLCLQMDWEFMQLFIRGNKAQHDALNAYITLSSIPLYTLMEGITKGRSLGKWITGTKAVKKNGAAISWKDALLRSACRFTFVEGWTAVFANRPCHDSLTRTFVVRIK